MPGREDPLGDPLGDSPMDPVGVPLGSPGGSLVEPLGIIPWEVLMGIAWGILGISWGIPWGIPQGIRGSFHGEVRGAESLWDEGDAPPKGRGWRTPPPPPWH